MTSKIIVNNIEADSGISSITFNDSIFVGDIDSSGTSTFNVVSGVSTIGVTTVHLTGINDLNYPTAGALSNRNLIINGSMVVDQRNSGSAVTINDDGFGNRKFPVDRFNVQRTGTIVIAAEQDTVAPPDFQNSIKLTVSTADTSVAAADYAFISHRLEGYTAAPLRYGTSDAKQATLSFWVRSSIAGTYCIAIGNYADNRSQVKEYSINSADTWEYKTVTFTGDTTGTWEKTNSGGMNINWTLLAGSDLQNTADTWHGSVELSTTNQTQWGSTTSATFYLTGVQMESGSVATPFEHKSYDQELAKCQRYFFMLGNATNTSLPHASYYNSTLVAMSVQLPVTMRANPTIYLEDGTDYFRIWRNGTFDNFDTFVLARPQPNCVTLDCQNNGASGTAGHSGPCSIVNNSARLGFIAEL